MSKEMEGTKDWFPRLEEYSPNITKKQWCFFVQDKTVFGENALTTFACILKAEVATCADMAEQFGRNANFYNNAVWQTGKKIHEKTNCPLSERSEGGNRFWSVCCQAKYRNGRYEFKIRPELREAFEETKVLEVVEVMEEEKMTLDENEFNEIYDSFYEKFPIESLPKMTLEEYTNDKKDDSFCYWLETKTEKLGSIWGGSAYKFGIFKICGNITGGKGVGKDDEYAWYSKYGNDRNEVFENVRARIVEIANAARSGKFSLIDEIDFGEAVKWKIAFLYSEMKLLNWFSKEKLIVFANHFGKNPKTNSVYDLQTAIFQEKGERSIWEFDRELLSIWKEYETQKNYYVISPNVWNDGNFQDLLDYMIKNHCVLMGWGKDNAKGNLFANLNIGDRIIVARRYDWKFHYFFLGTVSSKPCDKYDGAQRRFLDNFTLLENKNNDFLEKWSAAGSSQIPAIGRIDKNKNPEIIKIIESLLTGASTMPTKNTANYIDLLKNTRNIIFHGAPGTGKTFFAKQIAAEMNAETAFVQFHPSYDYTDFVEGLRPTSPNENGQIGFERKDGVFKEFCKRALKNLQDSQKSVEVLEKEISINENIENFLEKSIDEKTEFETATGNKFFIIESSENNIFVSIPANEKTSKLSLPKTDLIGLLSSENEITSGGEIKSFFNRKWRTQQDSYIWILYKQIHDLKQTVSAQKVEKIEKKPFVFIIDEINRGDLSKIFGELFYSIDPGYRGKKGSIQTQYQNLIEEGDVFREGFFIPENVYIIGTMNDIDRSVETMDFAFRRRFTFVEITIDSTMNMLDERIDENGNTTGLPPELAQKAKSRMRNLNNAISKIEGFSSAYHIGGAYFLKLNELGGDFEKLWKYHLEPLLKEYLRGTGNEEKLKELKAAYDREDENSSEEAETTESGQTESEE